MTSIGNPTRLPLGSPQSGDIEPSWQSDVPEAHVMVFPLAQVTVVGLPGRGVVSVGPQRKTSSVPSKQNCVPEAHVI